jgi:hypothetical protein
VIISTFNSLLFTTGNKCSIRLAPAGPTSFNDILAKRCKLMHSTDMGGTGLESATAAAAKESSFWRGVSCDFSGPTDIRGRRLYH